MTTDQGTPGPAIKKSARRPSAFDGVGRRGLHGCALAATVLRASRQRADRRRGDRFRRLPEEMMWCRAHVSVVLSRGMDLFYQKGIYLTTIEDITEGADVGKGTFYKYFKSKDALLEYLLQEGLNHIFAQTKERLSSHDTTLEEVISHIITARLDFFIERPEFLLVFHQIRGLLQLTTESSRGLRTVYSAHLDQLAGLLKKPLGRRHPLSRSLAVAIAAYTSGLLTYHLLFNKAFGLRSDRDALKSQLERRIPAIVHS